MLHPHEEHAFRTSPTASGLPGIVVAASDYVKTMSDAVAKWIPQPLISLGTDGFGRSEDREALRDFFEVDARYVTLATLYALAREGELDREIVSEALEDLEIDPAKVNPRLADAHATAATEPGMATELSSPTWAKALQTLDV